MLRDKAITGSSSNKLQKWRSGETSTLSLGGWSHDVAMFIERDLAFVNHLLDEVMGFFVLGHLLLLHSHGLFKIPDPRQPQILFLASSGFTLFGINHLCFGSSSFGTNFDYIEESR